MDSPPSHGVSSGLQNRTRHDKQTTSEPNQPTQKIKKNNSTTNRKITSSARSPRLQNLAPEMESGGEKRNESNLSSLLLLDLLPLNSIHRLVFFPNPTTPSSSLLRPWFVCCVNKACLEGSHGHCFWHRPLRGYQRLDGRCILAGLCFSTITAHQR